MTDVPNPNASPPLSSRSSGADERDRSLVESLHLRHLGWILRAVGMCAVVATVLGVIVVPGLHGSATDAVVNTWDRASSVFAYAMAILVSCGIVLSTVELVGSHRAETVPGALIVAGSSLIVVLLVVSMARAYVAPDAPPQVQVTLLVAVIASAVAATAGWRAVGGPHTRALSIVISCFALAALVRLSAWEMATIGGERASASLYGLSRGLSTLGVVIEALGQLGAAVWIGTRGRAGIALSSAAAVGAFAVTWGAALGGKVDAPTWAVALHTSLAQVATLPAPYALSGALSFLTASSVLLAAAALVLLEQPAAISAAFALALVSRGAFDAPLRALAIVAAAQWAVVALFDERILWASLTAPRASRPPSSAV